MITNDSPHATIVIAYYDITLPWNDHLDPVDDPNDAAEYSDFYNSCLESITIPRVHVLNHRRFQEGKLAPGDAFRGFFLAKGTHSIPNDLLALKQKLRNISAPFVVTDTTGKDYKSKEPVQLHY